MCQSVVWMTCNMVLQHRRPGSRRSLIVLIFRAAPSRGTPRIWENSNSSAPESCPEETQVRASTHWVARREQLPNRSLSFIVINAFRAIIRRLHHCLLKFFAPVSDLGANGMLHWGLSRSVYCNSAHRCHPLAYLFSYQFLLDRELAECGFSNRLPFAHYETMMQKKNNHMKVTWLRWATCLMKKRRLFFWYCVYDNQLYPAVRNRIEKYGRWPFCILRLSTQPTSPTPI